MICANCGAPIAPSRYGTTPSLCCDCEYYANQPADDTSGDGDGESDGEESAPPLEGQGKRPEPVAFRACVCGVLAIAALAGLVVGALVAAFVAMTR